MNAAAISHYADAAKATGDAAFEAYNRLAFLRSLSPRIESIAKRSGNPGYLKDHNLRIAWAKADLDALGNHYSSAVADLTALAKSTPK